MATAGSSAADPSTNAASDTGGITGRIDGSGSDPVVDVDVDNLGDTYREDMDRLFDETIQDGIENDNIDPDCL